MPRVQVHPSFSLRATAVLLDADRVLVHETDPGSDEPGWALPGGGPLFGEHTGDAVRRELHEELGVEVSVDRLLWVVEHFVIDREQLHAIDFVYLVEAPGDWAQRGEARFHSTEAGVIAAPAFTWLQRAELPALPVWPACLRTLLAARLPETVEHIVFYEQI